MEPQLYYRYDVITYAGMEDDYGHCGPGRTGLIEQVFHLKHRTPKGIVVDFPPNSIVSCPKLILHKTKRKYAWPTKEEALKSLIARKRTLISILHERIASAAYAIELAQTKLDNLHKK